MLEVLFVTEQNDNNLSCSAWDFRTGSLLMTYKGGGSAQFQSLNLLRANYVLTANIAKPLLHVWPINNQEPITTVRFVMPAVVQACALSNCCNYLVAGIQESIYVWHLATGKMLNTLSKHYQSITCIRFTDDSSHFVSSSRDGGVLVWNLTAVVGRGVDSQTPTYMFNDHGLPVTDVHIGVGGMCAYMFTVSLDRSCKVYDLNAGELLLSVVFAEGLQCLTVNKLETSVYVGTVDGKIYEFHIDSLPRTKEYHTDENHTNRFQGHTAGTAVNCLALSSDSQTLVSGGQDRQISIWHIPSRQLIKTVPHRGAITNIFLRVTLPEVFKPEQKQPNVFGGNLKRMMDAADDDDNMVIKVMVNERIVDPLHIKNDDDDDDDDNDLSAHLYTKNVSNGSFPVADAEKAQAEIESLRAQVKFLKEKNSEMYHFAINELLKSDDD